MEKKQLNEKSFASINKAARYIPDGMTTVEFERWLLNNGFYLKDAFHEVRDPNSGDLISSDGGHLWVRKENKVDDKKNFYSSVEEPSLREILLNVAGERGKIIILFLLMHTTSLQDGMSGRADMWSGLALLTSMRLR